MSGPEQIAVVGAGVAGLTAAWLLSRKFTVHVYEKNDYLGGHTRTFVVPDGQDAGIPVDMGFIVMNQRNYPLLTRIFDQLNVERGDSNMSFSYEDESTGYLYAGHNFNSLFARRSNLLNPVHWGLIRDILRFNRTASADL
ncbi:MAG: FAD-dependent oxidoreductase, partial [Verrucomicrobiota bacterium]